MQRETYESSRKTNKSARMSRIVAKVMHGEVLTDADINAADCDIALFDMAAARQSLPRSVQVPLQLTFIQNVGHHLGK